MFTALYPPLIPMLTPLNHLLRASLANYPTKTNDLMSRQLRTAIEIFERQTRDYQKPAFNIGTETAFDESANDESPNQAGQIETELAMALPFCHLRRFGRRDNRLSAKKILLIAPLSGHFATLLRDTINFFVNDHQVFITDWQDCRHIPISQGEFNLDDYVDVILKFAAHLGDDLHIVAICQPTVPVLMAAAWQAMNGNKLAKSLSLCAGPIDTRHHPTAVNRFAERTPISFFENFMIQTVGDDFAGAGRRIYPGYIQLNAFISMNFFNHWQKSMAFYVDRMRGDDQAADRYTRFYDEYLATLDMPAEYYLDTVDKVFQSHQLPRGEIIYRGTRLDFAAMTQLALMTVEGGKDDITGQNQTHAAHDICTNVVHEKRRRYTHQGVGHFGVFSGSHFRQIIGPEIAAFIASCHR